MCQQIGRNLGELVALDVYSNKRRERADRRKLAWRRKPVIAQRPAAINARISRCRRDYRTVALVGIGQANVRTVLNEQSYPLPPMVGCESMKKKSAPGLMTHGTEVPLHAAGCERWSRLASGAMHGRKMENTKLEMNPDNKPPSLTEGRLVRARHGG